MRYERTFVAMAFEHKENILDHNRISVHKPVMRPSPERRPKRTACIFPSPLIRFDLSRRTVVAVWSWVGVECVDVPNGIKIKVAPSVLLVSFGTN